MFFKLLKLAGLDINAKIAELKADLAFKAEQASEQVTRKARAMAIVAWPIVVRRHLCVAGPDCRIVRAL